MNAADLATLIAAFLALRGVTRIPTHVRAYSEHAMQSAVERRVRLAAPNRSELPARYFENLRALVPSSLKKESHNA